MGYYRFNTDLLYKDFLATCRRKRISRNKACNRIGLQTSTLSYIANGRQSRATSVHSLVKMLKFINTTDIEKYIIEEED